MGFSRAGEKPESVDDGGEARGDPPGEAGGDGSGVE